MKTLHRLVLSSVLALVLGCGTTTIPGGYAPMAAGDAAVVKLAIGGIT